MSGVKSTLAMVELTSVNGSAANGDPIFVDGATCEFHGLVAPAALFAVQVSNDKATWAAASDADGAAITSVQNVFLSVRERPKWLRVIVASDGTAPRLFRANIHILVDTG